MFRTRPVTPRPLPLRTQASKADASAESRQKIGFRCYADHASAHWPAAGMACTVTNLFAGRKTRKH